MGKRFKRGDVKPANNDNPKPKNNNGNGNGKLTLKQWKFAVEYVKDGNGTRAAERAGYSPKGAKVQASVLLTNTNVKEAIDQRKRELLAAAQVTPARIIQEYKKIAFTDLPDFIDCKRLGKFTYEISIEDFKSLTADQRACLSGIEETKDGVKIKLHDKTKALDALSRINAMFTDKVERVMSDDEVRAYAISAGKDPQVFLEKWRENRGK